MRSTLVMMPLSDAPKSWLYSREGRDSTAIRTLSRWPVSQSVMASVEVNRTGRSATLTGGGWVPPTIHDLPVTTSGPITRDESFPAGWEFFVVMSAVLESVGFECLPWWTAQPVRSRLPACAPSRRSRCSPLAPATGWHGQDRPQRS